MNYVEHIHVKMHEVIGAGLGTRLANILCLLALVWGCYAAWNKADYDNIKGVYQAHIIAPTIHRMQQMLAMYW